MIGIPEAGWALVVMTFISNNVSFSSRGLSELRYPKVTNFMSPPEINLGTSRLQDKCLTAPWELV